MYGLPQGAGQIELCTLHVSTGCVDRALHCMNCSVLSLKGASKANLDLDTVAKVGTQIYCTEEAGKWYSSLFSVMHH